MTEEVEVAPPPPPPEEKPLFDLEDLLKARRGKEGVGFWEVLAYLDYKDRREDREWRRREMERMNQSQSPPNPEIEVLKTEVSELRKTVGDLLETIRSQQQQEAQKQFVEGVVKQTTDKIMPELQTVKQKLEEYDERLASGGKPPFSLEDLKETLKDSIDRIGEKVGAGGKTIPDLVSDIDKIMVLFDSIEKRVKRGEGEVDYKTMAVSTVGEIGKELIGAYRDIATFPPSLEAPPPETPASTMQTIIKRQVQNYITQRMKTGAATMNVQQAAEELGLTSGQVVWAYQTLMKEGWFHVRVPTKGKRKVKESEVPPEEKAAPEEETFSEEEQVFNPPAET